MSDLIRRDGDKITVHLHPGQTKAHDSEKRFIFIIAGTQSGKTSYLPIWLDREITRKGEGDYLCITSTYDLLKLKFLPELQNYFVNLFGWGYSAGEKTIFRQYKPRMFTRIICRSADAEGGLESASAKGALFDECGQDGVKVNAWEAILRRLSLSQGRVLAGTTPYNLGWLKTQIFDKWRAGDPDIQVVQFKSTMNPRFPIEEYERARRTLPTWKFEMFYNGEFSRPAGLIYEDFDQKHIIPAFTFPSNWARYLGVDFGAVNTAKLWIAQDPESQLFYAYREALHGNKTTAEHVKEVLSYNERNLLAWGGAKSESQQRMDWSASGFAVAEPPISDVEAGINRGIALFKERRIYIFDTLTGLIDQLGTYSRELDANGQPTEKIKDKATFHYLDAFRYVASGITQTGIHIPNNQPEQKSKWSDDKGEGWARRY